VIQSFSRLTTWIVAGFHEDFGYFAFVEDTASNSEGGFEGDTFFGSYNLIRMVRIAPQTPDVGVMPTSSDPEDDRLVVLVEDGLYDLSSEARELTHSQ
jgi:hypothetical protein